MLKKLNIHQRQFGILRLMLYFLSFSYLFRTVLIYAETVVYKNKPKSEQVFETTIATALIILFEFLPIGLIFYYHFTSSGSIKKEAEGERASLVETELMRDQANASRTTGGSRVAGDDRGSKSTSS